MTFRIGVIGGDGIGPEVTAEGLKVLRCAGASIETTEFDLGGARYLRTGETLPDAELSEIKKQDAIMLGAVGTPDVPPGVLEQGLLLSLRRQLDLYVNYRPVKLYPGVDSALAGKGPAEIDMVVIRENSEGPYLNDGGFLRKDTAGEIATQGSVNTRVGVERILRYAFEVAQGRPRKKLTMCHKTNVLLYAGDLWKRAFAEASADYPDVETEYLHIDAACLFFVTQPERFDVVVTENLFGDIITDLGAAISGGLGLAASANLNPTRQFPSMFEPVHGSAPDIAGTGKANPMAAIMCASMMLEFLGEKEQATAIDSAVMTVLEKIGGTGTSSHSPSEVGDMVADAVTNGG